MSTKTVRFREAGGPDVLQIEHLEVGAPGPGEALVRIEAIGLNRAEVLFRSDAYIEPIAHFPARLGNEAAGVVEALGPDVVDVEVGQAVSVLPVFSHNDYGVYAERAIVPAAALVPRPAGLDPIAGAAVWMPYLTAYGAMVEVAGVRAADVVAINAASSGVGLAAIHTARRLGATPIAITRTRAKRDRLLEEGAAAVLVTDETPDVRAELAAATGGRGVDHVFDAVAGPGVADLMAAVAPGGTIIVWGGLSGEPTPYPGLELGMPAVALRTFTLPEIARDPARMRRAVAFVTSGLDGGWFHATVDRTLPLTDVVAAHRHLDAHTHIGKIVLTVDH
jgi:NADPH:quinone reductase-like Zn-dependent oxidoreductase